MSAKTSAPAEDRQRSSAAPTPVGLIIKYIALLIIDALALLLIYQLASDGVWELAIFIAIITVFANVINLRRDLMPLQWISPALILMALMVIYPLIYTVYVAFTNYGDGHLLTKQQTIGLIEEVDYLPDDAATFDRTFYRNAADEYALLLQADDGTVSFARVGEPREELPDVDYDAPPQDIGGYQLVPANEQRFLAPSQTDGVLFGDPERPILVQARSAAQLEQRYIYDAELDIFTDQETGDVYVGNDEIGQFVNVDAYEAALEENPSINIDTFRLLTGYRVVIGFDNFVRFLTSPAISGPLLTVFIWTVTFAVVSVFSTFAVGLLIALLLQADTPGKRIFRTILIVPYAIPALIAVATWKGMLNPNFGVLSGILESVFGFNPPFFTDPNWAKFGILMINLWLGYPYFMLVCSGALAAIPSDMYEAAKVDGANAWQQFRKLTLPLLLVAVGPLLIASFTFNFNNFVIIDVYNEGNPPIPGTPTPAGYTDILISYAFRLAFGSGRGADYGLASAITIIIFIMVAVVTLLQFRFTRQWEETSENV